MAMAAGGLERDHPDAAILAGARKDDGDGAWPANLCQRDQQRVKRQAHAMLFARNREMQNAPAQDYIATGRDNCDRIGRQGCALGRFGHGHRGMAGQQFGHQAFVAGLKMLNYDENHDAMRGQCGKQARHGIQSARRSANGDNHRRGR
jgi:hypothetical protein